MPWSRDGLPSAMRRFRSCAAALLATILVAAASSGKAVDFDTIKTAAAREGTLTVWHNTPKQETMDALVALFDQRFGMDIKIARVPVSGAQMSARLMTEKRGGRFTVDVFIADDRHLPFLVENGLVEKTDWVGLFAGAGKLDPVLLKSAADHLIPDYVGYGLEFRHDIYGIVYNTKLVAAPEVPKRWEELADAKWSRKLAIDAGLSPLARLVPVIGRDAVLDLAQKIVANRPVYADGQPSAAKKVVSGETPLGALSLSLGLEERGKGAPVDLAFPEPQALISQLIVSVAKEAPHPNLARLWAAWLASEGMNSAPMIAEGDLRAWPGAPGPFGAYFASHHLQVRRAGSIAELEDANRIRKDLDAVVGAGR
jgi:ABC-type Fe3+ transport system substrate-binding protein